MSNAMLNDLPEDVLMDIFSRLPVKTLLQFKSVCKSWYDIIKDPVFITKHVNRSNHGNNGYLAVTRRDDTFGSTCLISLFSYETFREIYNITIPSKKEHSKAPFRIVGSCNGVMCLNVSKIGDTNFLFNPATNEFKELPKPDYPVNDLGENEILLYIGFGFGHNPETNDYKLVRISFCKKMKESFYSTVDVYSLSTNSWRRKDKLVHGTISGNNFSKGELNGALHWKGAIEKKKVIHHIIISFNIRDEVHGYIKLPAGIELDNKDWHPFVRNGLLCIVVVSSRRQYEPRFDTWVMNEYGVEETWTKQWSLGPLLAWNLVGCGRNEELLFAASTRMYLYDLQKIKPPHDDILDGDILGSNFVDKIEVVNHIESLVTIEGTKVYVKRRKRSWFRENQFLLFVIFLKIISLTLCLLKIKYRV